VLAYGAGAKVEPICHLRVGEPLGHEYADLHFARREHPGSRFRKLYGQRNAVEPLAHSCYGGRVLPGKLEVRGYRLRALDEESDGLVAHQLLDGE
jgi:hypothetical protein